MEMQSGCKGRDGIVLISCSIIIALCTMAGSNALTITEIMYNPLGADAGREWIEVSFDKTEGCINLSQGKLIEEDTSHNIYEHLRIENCSSAIISNNASRFLIDYPDYMEKGACIYRSSFSLSNTGEDIAIFLDGRYADYMNYSMLLSIMQVEEGRSLSLVDGVWISSVPDPGIYLDPSNYSDELSDDLSNNSSNDPSNYSTGPEDNSTEIISINESINESSDESDALYDLINLTANTTQMNITWNQTNSTINDTANDTASGTNTSSEYPLQKCKVSINITIRNETRFFENAIQIRYANKLIYLNKSAKDDYVIEYWIEDIDGNMIKPKSNTTNQDEKSFTPKIDERDRAYIIKANIRSSTCDIISGSASKIMIIHDPQYAPKTAQCPECECKTTRSANMFSGPLDTVCDGKIASLQSQTEKPQTRIVNVCNITCDQNSSDATASACTYSLPSQTNTSNNAQTGKATSMVVYESPNLKNRLYALIGLVLVVLSCLGIAAVRFLKQQ